MSDIEIMEFPYGAFLKLRLEFVLLRDNELEAKIMRIIEGWMIDQKKEWMKACAQAASDGKPEPPEPDYYVTLSYAQIIAQLYMFNSSRKGEGKEVVEGKHNSITRRTVGKAMQALIDDKVVFTRPNPNATKEYDAAQYKLNCPLVQEQMKLLPKNPMSYLGSNGRINGDPCEIISHPPREKNSHPMRTDFTSPRENIAHGDVKKIPTLIDINNRDSNLSSDKLATDVATPTDLPSLSDQERLAYHLEEARKIEEKNPPKDLEHLFTSPVDNSEPPVEKQADGDFNSRLKQELNEQESRDLKTHLSVNPVPPIAKVPTKTVEPRTTRKTGKTRNTEPLQKPLPKLEEPTLSEKARAIWEEWTGLPWHGGITPKLTQTAADHCETLALADDLITKDIMFKVRNFAKKNDTKGFYEGKKWTLGNMVTEYPNWKSAQYQEQTVTQTPKKHKITKEYLASLPL